MSGAPEWLAGLALGTTQVCLGFPFVVISLAKQQAKVQALPPRWPDVLRRRRGAALWRGVGLAMAVTPLKRAAQLEATARLPMGTGWSAACTGVVGACLNAPRYALLVPVQAGRVDSLAAAFAWQGGTVSALFRQLPLQLARDTPFAVIYLSALQAVRARATRPSRAAQCGAAVGCSLLAWSILYPVDTALKRRLLGECWPTWRTVYRGASAIMVRSVVVNAVGFVAACNL